MRRSPTEKTGSRRVSKGADSSRAGIGRAAKEQLQPSPPTQRSSAVGYFGTQRDSCDDILASCSAAVCVKIWSRIVPANQPLNACSTNQQLNGVRGPQCLTRGIVERQKFSTFSLTKGRLCGHFAIDVADQPRSAFLVPVAQHQASVTDQIEDRPRQSRISISLWSQCVDWQSRAIRQIWSYTSTGSPRYRQGMKS